MKVAFFSTHSTWLTHLETELEIIQNHLDKGHKVDFYTCNNKQFKSCENILSRSLLDSKKFNDITDLTCEFCLKRQNNGFTLLKGNGFSIHSLINNEQLDIDYHIDDSYFDSTKRFKELYYDNNFDIGWSILSSYISFLRNPFVNLNDHKYQINKLFSDSIRVYESAKMILTNKKYDRIYIFNGRLSYTRGLFRLGLKFKLPTYIHERGSVPEKYELFINNLPHSMSYFRDEVMRYWKNGRYLQRNIIGRKYFKDKLNSFSGSWVSVTDNFVKGLLPSDFNSSLKNIVLFTSSEDEYQSIDSSWDNPFFESQLNGIEFLCEEFENKYKDDDCKFYIRIHPYSKGIDKQYLSRLLSVSSHKNIIIIPPESTVSSYDLMFSANRIITFGSTITIESVYWGVPVIMLGKSFYSNFKGPMFPKTKDEIFNICFKESLSKPTNKDVIKIGYYLRTFGIKYKHYSAVDYLNGYFKGVNLSTGELLVLPEPRITTAINRIKGFLYPIYSLIKNRFLTKRN